ncbi:MAG: ATP-binding protein [Candidatus Bathyarchaeota archaeon]|nr:ATP-binding protein [Candidatus Bathyarchaeota archaeon]
MSSQNFSIEVLSKLKDPVISLDEQFRIVFVNETQPQIFGITKNEMLGKSLWQVAPKTAGTLMEHKLREAQLTRKIITFQWVGAYTGNILDSTIYPSGSGLTIISVDVTESRNAQAALKQRTEKLEQTQRELEAYASQMEQLANERAKQLQEKERLAAIGATAGMVGHDIRNPLQAIIGDVFLLRDALTAMPEQTKPEVSESLDSIEKNIGYINKIVADLQDYARPLKPEYSYVDLSEIMTCIVGDIRVPGNINVIVSSNSFQKIKTEPTFIRRILTNLVINAVQAMPEGGNLELSSLIGEKVCITVADTGLGIPDSVKPRLFAPMVTTKSKGQGLGLAVAKRLAEALSGKISFESQVGKGTKFTIELPLQQ